MKRAVPKPDPARKARVTAILDRTRRARGELDYVLAHGYPMPPPTPPVVITPVVPRARRKPRVPRPRKPIAPSPPRHPIMSLYDAERWYVLGALRLHDHNISATADALGIFRSSLQRKLRKWDVAIAHKQKGRPVRGAPLQTR